MGINYISDCRNIISFNSTSEIITAPDNQYLNKAKRVTILEPNEIQNRSYSSPKANKGMKSILKKSPKNIDRNKMNSNSNSKPEFKIFLKDGFDGEENNNIESIINKNNSNYEDINYENKDSSNLDDEKSNSEEKIEIEEIVEDINNNDEKKHDEEININRIKNKNEEQDLESPKDEYSNNEIIKLDLNDINYNIVNQIKAKGFKKDCEIKKEENYNSDNDKDKKIDKYKVNNTNNNNIPYDNNEDNNNEKSDSYEYI